MSTEQTKQIGREIVAAAESYLLEFIRAARSDGASVVPLDERRERLFAAIDAAIDAAEENAK